MSHSPGFISWGYIAILLTSEKHIFTVPCSLSQREGINAAFCVCLFGERGGMLMTWKHIPTTELGTVVPMSSISFRCIGLPQTTSWPQEEDIISPGLPAEKSKCRDVTTKVTLTSEQGSALRNHMAKFRGNAVHLFALGLKRILSRIQQTSLVSLKYIELESVRGCCQPSQYFHIPRLAIFLLHC